MKTIILVARCSSVLGSRYDFVGPSGSQEGLVNATALPVLFG